MNINFLEWHYQSCFRGNKVERENTCSFINNANLVWLILNLKPRKSTSNLQRYSIFARENYKFPFRVKNTFRISERYIFMIVLVPFKAFCKVYSDVWGRKRKGEGNFELDYTRVYFLCFAALESQGSHLFIHRLEIFCASFWIPRKDTSLMHI